MKKYFVVLSFMVVSTGLFAQFEKGTKLVGGSLAFSANTYKTRADNTTRSNSTSTDFSLQPNFGYFIANQFVLGAGLDLGVSNTKSKNTDYESTTSSFSISPFVRYYLPQGLFFQGQFGLGASNTNGTTGGGQSFDSKESVTSWSLAAGYAIFLNDNVALEPMLGYGSTIYKDKDDDVKQMFPGLFLRMGFQIYLR